MKLKNLINKLNPVTKKGLEQAASLADRSRNYAVEVEHWLLQILETKEENDLSLLLRHFQVDITRVESDLRQSISRFRKGSGSTPVLSGEIPKLISESWSLASIEYESDDIRSGHLIQILLTTPENWSRLNNTCATLMGLDSAKVGAVMPEILNLSKEQSIKRAKPKAEEAAPIEEEEEPASDEDKLTYPNLSRFGTNLTILAQKDKIDPVIGRETEIHQLYEILLRRRQNNPILTGEAGVGKTAVAEGFALEIAKGTAPEPFLNIHVWSLDLGSLKAGAGVRGEYEQRLKSVITEVKDSPRPIILFVDEAHLLMGGGGGGEPADAANLIKPELARGELRMVAATTWSDYKRYVEKDPALIRRFQVIKVREPSPEQTSLIIHGIKGKMIDHHQVEIHEDAIEAAISLSNRYIVGRKLPDKAIAVLDTACARTRLEASQRGSAAVNGEDDPSSAADVPSPTPSLADVPAPPLRPLTLPQPLILPLSLTLPQPLMPLTFLLNR